MLRSRLAVVVLTVVGLSGSAQARFGSSGSSSGGHSSSSSASTSGGTRSSSSGSTHGAAPVGHAPPSASGWSWGWRRAAPYRYGFYSGSYVPSYGYGYACAYGVPSSGVVLYEGAAVEVAQEPPSLRFTANADGMVFVNGAPGATLGIAAMLEGERWGVSVLAQDIFVRSDTVPGAMDSLPQFNAHLTFAFLSGRYGKLRAEAGLDTVWATDRIFLGATVGFSGMLWVGGPFALEGAVMATPYPYWQLDYRGGLVVGLGPLGLRAGWRTQVLDDRGLVDGIIHRDVFMGPYVGLGVTL
jgi:hypothetical protein